MSKSEENNFHDIYDLELKIRAKINELHWKTESLEETRKELSEVRRTLYETQTLLENERRSSKHLEMELKSAMEAARRAEDEKKKNHEQIARMRIDHETASIERDVLLNKARIANLENVELRARIDELETSNESRKTVNVTLEESLMELRNNVSRVHNTLHSNAEKLEREQVQLRKSVAASLQFGQRVQSIVKTSHIARQRDKKKIEELQERVNDLVARETTQTAMQITAVSDRMDVGNLHLKMESTLQELRRKLENNSIDDKLSMLCDELRKVDERFVNKD